jgi:D-alanyl-D-alanine dipeptidase
LLGAGCRTLEQSKVQAEPASHTVADHRVGEADTTAARETDVHPALASGAAAACAGQTTPIDAAATQLVVVTTQGFDAWHARLQRYERAPSQAFHAVGEPMAVVLGRSGLAWGDGLHGSGAPPGHAGPLKREGDGRSPAGAFEIGVVHGYAARAPSGLVLPYQPSGPRQRCVDDPNAAQYNRVVEPGPEGETWQSAERMRRDDAVYELALDIEHNRSPVVPGHGSCIFVHAWVSPHTPVTGCTGMDPSELKQLLTWLRPGAVWVALPTHEYRLLQSCWQLPDSSQ